MTDKDLIRSCDEAVQRERDALADVLRHLREIERRRLFSELNYKSLFDYCVRRLGYSEDQAYRRINAMKLIKHMPEAEEKIEQGTLSLSNASLIQRAIAQGTLKVDSNAGSSADGESGAISKTQILELINQIENKSRREAEKILGDAKTTLHIQVSDETDEKFQQLRGLTAHKFKNVSELFEAMVDLALDEKHGLLPAKASLAKKHRIMDKHSSGVDQATNAQVVEQEAIEPFTTEQVGDKHTDPERSANLKSDSLNTRKFTALKCTRCRSNHAPQTEHIIPRAKGGTDDLKNLTILCRNCNQRAAIREFGLKKMQRFLEPDAER